MYCVAFYYRKLSVLEWLKSCLLDLLLLGSPVAKSSVWWVKKWCAEITSKGCTSSNIQKESAFLWGILASFPCSLCSGAFGLPFDQDRPVKSKRPKDTSTVASLSGLCQESATKLGCCSVCIAQTSIKLSSPARWSSFSLTGRLLKMGEKEESKQHMSHTVPWRKH